MSNLNIISRHLDFSRLNNIENVDTICIFTGEPIKKGIHIKHLIKDTFTDHEYLKYRSQYVSLDVSATMSNIITGKKGLVSLRNFSFISNKKSLELLSNAKLFYYLTNPPDTPFYFCLSFNNKKHLAFKSKLNYSQKEFIVTTDFGDCVVNIEKVYKILPVLKNWYCIIPEKQDSKQQPTYFTKKEILNGCKDFRRIENYPGDFFKEDQFLETYRSSMLLKIITHCLIKNKVKC